MTEYCKGEGAFPIEYRSSVRWLVDAIIAEERAYRRRHRLMQIPAGFPWHSLPCAYTVDADDRDSRWRMRSIERNFRELSSGWAAGARVTLSDLSCGLMMVSFRMIIAA